MNDPWTHPDANEDGFVSFLKIREAARAMSLDDFLAAYPVPCLQCVDTEPSGVVEASSPAAAEDRGVQLLTERIEGVHLLRYLAKAAFVTKRPGNPFPHLISIGRSKACDITVSVESISKVHGYFVTDGEGWSFTDHGSTNGSKVGPHVLGKGEKRPLEEGVTLKLGLDFSLRFHTPRGLFFAARV